MKVLDLDAVRAFFLGGLAHILEMDDLHRDSVTHPGSVLIPAAWAFAEARATKGQPTAIIAETMKGKGVSFMENQVGWHGKAPNDEQFEQAMAELTAAGEEL